MTSIDHVIAVIIIALAAYRLATDFAWELGPFEVFINVRSAAITKFGAQHWFSQGISCPICLSFWFSILLAICWFMFSPLPVIALAAAGLASLVLRH